jgi:hypothetical protein
MPAAIEILAPEVQENLIEQSVRVAANNQAMAEPIPGQVREAILGELPIKVGKFTVRPCFDGDIRYLSLLEHPLNELRLATAAMVSQDKDSREKEFEAIWKKFVGVHNYRGPSAWELSWILTHDIDEVNKVFRSGGLEALREKAEGEFCRLSPKDVVEVTQVCISQYLKSWGPMLAYEAAESSDDDAPVKKNS